MGEFYVYFYLYLEYLCFSFMLIHFLLRFTKTCQSIITKKQKFVYKLHTEKKNFKLHTESLRQQ